VVDLAFYLAGNPIDWKTYSKSGKLNWHSKTNFVGAGQTDKGVLFSYISNWESAGRWGVELLTRKKRITLKPLETILIQKLGEINVLEHRFDRSIDDEYKAGLFNMIRGFLQSNNNNICSLKEHYRQSFYVFSNILGFKSYNDL
jgi:hypothetical protein